MTLQKLPLAEDKQMIREFLRKNLLDLAKETLSGGFCALPSTILRCVFRKSLSCRNQNSRRPFFFCGSLCLLLLFAGANASKPSRWVSFLLWQLCNWWHSGIVRLVTLPSPVARCWKYMKLLHTGFHAIWLSLAQHQIPRGPWVSSATRSGLPPEEAHGTCSAGATALLTLRNRLESLVERLEANSAD